MARTLGLLGVALGLAACGDGFAIGDHELGDDDGAGTGAGLDGDGDAGGGSGGGDDSNADDDSDDDSGSPAGDDGGGDWSCVADCGPEGSCFIDATGVPACSCEAGSVAYGMRCLPCVKTDSVADVILERAELTLVVTIDGQEPPTSLYERARIWLRDRASGDEILAGETTEGTLQVSVLPGTYDVMYDQIVGGSVLPRNHSALIVPQLQVAKSDTVELDVPVVTVEGDFTIAGAEPPASQYESGEIVLVDPATGDEVLLGHTRDGSYSARVLPGAYEVHYRRTLGGTEVPLNGNARFADAVIEPTDGSARMRLDLDVPMISVTGSFLLDGAPAPTLDYESARISLVDTGTGDELVLGETADGDFAVKVVPGSYDVLYARKLGGATVPLNNDAILETVSVDVDSDALTIDIPTTTISGSFTLDGAPVVPGPGEDAIVSLVDDLTGDEIPLGHLSDGTFERVVLAGSYTVTYGQLTAAGILPANTGAQLQQVKLDQGAMPAETIDIATAAVSGQILLDGAPPPTSEYSDGRLYLRNAATGDSVLLGNTRNGGYAGTVVPGTYDLVYVVETAGDDVPVNTESKLAEAVDATGDVTLDVDIPVFDLVGDIAVGGEAPPSTETDRAQLVLQDVLTEDRIFLGGTDAGSFGQRLTGGTYVVLYEGLTSSGLIPANEHAGVACVMLTSD